MTDPGELYRLMSLDYIFEVLYRQEAKEAHVQVGVPPPPPTHTLILVLYVVYFSP